MFVRVFGSVDNIVTLEDAGQKKNGLPASEEDRSGSPCCFLRVSEASAGMEPASHPIPSAGLKSTCRDPCVSIPGIRSGLLQEADIPASSISGF